MRESTHSDALRRRQLEALIRRLHAGATVDDVKADFARDFGRVSAAEIAAIEEALIRDGLPVAEIQRLCDVHAAVFKGSIEEIHRPQDPTTVPGHPLHTLRRENQALAALMANRIRPHLEDYIDTRSQSALMALREDLAELTEIDLHYSKKENLFFPFLEQYGVTAPPKVMWGVDDEIRASLREIRSSLDSLEDRRSVLRDKLDALLNQIDEMIFKEENILFPLLLETLKPGDWAVVASGMGEIGYFLIDGAPDWRPDDLPSDHPDAAASAATGVDGVVQLPSGRLRLDELTRLLDTLPLDITFVGADDTVQYFSQSSERIFTRTLAVLGRAVANCHPPASVHVVEQIIDDLKNGRKDHEDFWLRMGDRYIYIRYFAVRALDGTYLGTLEVTQDIAPIQEIEGEKRLLS